jgi:hypothetical protein
MYIDCKNVTYGLKNGVLIHISDVESGLRCGCVCAGCKGELIAKKGEIKVHHFAHVNAECAHAYESALHLLAKEKLKQQQVALNLPDYKGIKTTGTQKIGKINLNDFEVREEVWVGDFKPDIVLFKFGKPVFFIEIAVTHFVDEDKFKKIEKHGVSCLEIDLSKCSIEDLEKDASSFFNQNSYWIFNPKAESTCLDNYRETGATTIFTFSKIAESFALKSKLVGEFFIKVDQYGQAERCRSDCRLGNTPEAVFLCSNVSNKVRVELYRNSINF